MGVVREWVWWEGGCGESGCGGRVGVVGERVWGEGRGGEGYLIFKLLINNPCRRSSDIMYKGNFPKGWNTLQPPPPPFH